VREAPVAAALTSAESIRFVATRSAGLRPGVFASGFGIATVPVDAVGVPPTAFLVVWCAVSILNSGFWILYSMFCSF